MFDFLKRRDGVPDVGKEEDYEAQIREQERRKKVLEQQKEEELIDEELPAEEQLGQQLGPGAMIGQRGQYIEEIPVRVSRGKKGKKGKKGKMMAVTRTIRYSPSLGDSAKVELEKVKAKVDALNEMMKGYGERMGLMSEQIGEIRSMSVENEKEIAKAVGEGIRATDIVKEVKPEKLRMDYQKIDLRVATLSEKIDANRQYIEAIVEELKDLKRSTGIFIGTDALLKLNDDVKKDLISIQKMNEKVKLHADKSEQIFIELKKAFAESEKIGSTVGVLEAGYSEIKKELEKLKVDYSTIVEAKDFSEFKKTVDTRLRIHEEAFGEIETLRDENEKLSRMIEKTLSIAKKNEEDTASIAATIGEDKIQSINDYENRLMNMLEVLDTMSAQFSEIKRKLGELYQYEQRLNQYLKGEN